LRGDANGLGKTAAEINMTPTIDILLVLPITFMLLPARTKGLPSELPEPAPENQPSAPNSLDSVLRIRKDRSLDINSQPVLMLELEERLKSLFVTSTAPLIWSMPALRR
jgi:biopolymer transport protein ExbD